MGVNIEWKILHVLSEDRKAHVVWHDAIPANTTRWNNAVLLLGQRRDAYWAVIQNIIVSTCRVCWDVGSFSSLFVMSTTVKTVPYSYMTDKVYIILKTTQNTEK